ncbi:ribokinase [Paenibacillus harenae]|uniref:ribokinase n=1 Tax=Paenibacillus harenae TaxID=306543 RepID=UPI000411AD65|nr:ribokinase [Paenibacillus harenae]
MPSPKIAIVGSLNMDLIVSVERMPLQGETLEGDSIHYIPGGKGANQAVGCAKLGADVSMVGAVGRDAFGKQILNNLDHYGLPVDHIAILDNVPTGTATILHTPEDNCIVIVPGANSGVTAAYIESKAELIRESDVMIVQLEIPVEAVEQALIIAKDAGVKTILNPAPAKRLSTELLRLPDILTPNETEFENLSGCMIKSDTELADAMRSWEQKYGNTLVITRGKLGVSYLQNGELCTMKAPIVEVKDTTGAGDCFNAALGIGIASSWKWEDAVAFAVKAASVSVTKFGAQAGMPDLRQLE